MTRGSVALEEVGRFTDRQLIARLRELVCADRVVGARLLVHLGEVDARGLYREQAYSSMFAYCVEELHMSEAQAYLRIHAARLGREFPLVVELFGRGALHLSAIKLLGPHLTTDNHVEVLERASGKGKREIELLVAELAPKPDVPNRMRKLPEGSQTSAKGSGADGTVGVGASPARSIVEESVAAPSVSRALDGSAALAGLAPCIAAPAALESQASQAAAVSESVAAARTIGANDGAFALEQPRQRGSSVPLRPGRYKVELTAGQGLHDKLEQLRALLRHRVPDGDLAVIVELAVDSLIDRTMKQRFAQTHAAKKSRSQPTEARDVEETGCVQRDADPQVRSRYIPRAVVREVYERDAGQCTFVSSDGKRCSERGFLELHHHDVPYARGGKSTVDNLRLTCRAHNALFAERDYGAQYVRFKQLHARASRATKSLVPVRVQV